MIENKTEKKMAKKKTKTRNQNRRGAQMSATKRVSQLPDTSKRKRTQGKQTSQPKRTVQLRDALKNNVLLWGGGALLVVVIAAGAILVGSQQNSPAAEGLPAEISVDEAYQRYQDGAFVLDVRTPEEWDDYHAPDTTLIPLDELPDRLGELPQDEEIVVVCRSGNRSQEGRDILLDAGFEQVTSMTGGLNAWREAGYLLEEGNP
jgi:rhodanese-related sulfurtransferase